MYTVAGTMDISSENVFCKEVGITSGMLLGDKTFPKHSSIKKGLLLELHRIKKNNEKYVSWPVYSGWIEKLLVDPGSFSVNALRRSVLSIQSQYEKLKKNADVSKFLHEVYTVPVRLNPCSDLNPCSGLPTQKSLQLIANEKLVPELTALREEIIKKDAVIEKLKLKCNTRNINKRMKRREEKISKLQLTIKSYKRKKSSYTIKHLKSLADRYKAKCIELESKLSCANCDFLGKKLDHLEIENKELQEQNAELIDQCNHHINFYKDNKYTDDLRLCIMELLSYNVGILKIELVLKSVFKLLNVTYDRLPKHSTINDILIESRSLSHLQLAEALNTMSNNTLHSDGTTKFNHKYQSYQVVTEVGSLSLGLQVCGRHKSWILVYV